MRNYIRKTNRGMVSQQQMQAAASEIIEKGRKLRQVAKEFDICHATLFRFVRKLKLGENPTVGYKPRLLFTNTQEKEIANHLVQYARIFLGLSIDEARKLAYQCMVRQKYPNVPSAWYKNGSVTREWLDKFLLRHPQVRIRSAKVTTGQSKDYINEFFSMLFKLLEEYKFLPSRMYHLVDISITPVVKYPKMATGSTFVPVGQGNIVNMQLSMNAGGEITPPMFVLPKANQKLEDGPHGLITGNDTGQITATEFSTYIDHFTKHAKPNPLDPILLLLHGNQYIDVNVLEKARANSIVLLYFPVCSKVERLESFMQPFEELASCLAKSVKSAQVVWLRAHPGKAVTCKIPKLVGKLLPPESDIKEAFRMTGLWPFRPSVVVGEDFVPSAVEELFLYDVS